MDLNVNGSFRKIGLVCGELVICAAPIPVLARAVTGVEFPSNVCITAVSSASAITNVDSPFPRDARLSQNSSPQKL